MRSVVNSDSGVAKTKFKNLSTFLNYRHLISLGFYYNTYIKTSYITESPESSTTGCDEHNNNFCCQVERFPWPDSATDGMRVLYVTSVASPNSLAASL